MKVKEIIDKIMEVAKKGGCTTIKVNIDGEEAELVICKRPQQGEIIITSHHINVLKVTEVDASQVLTP